MSNQEILESIRGKLIVSCQALPDEPLHSSYTVSYTHLLCLMGRMNSLSQGV